MTLALVVLLVPFIWLAGFTPVAYQVLSIWIGLRNKNPFVRLGIIEFAILAFMVVYLISILLAILRGEDFIRALAGFYNLSIWGMGFFLIASRREFQALSIRGPAFVLLCIVLLFAWAVVLIPGIATEYPTLLSSVLDTSYMPSNIRSNVTIGIRREDFSSFGDGERLSIFSPYPTAFGMLVFLLTCLSWPEEGGRTRSMRTVIITGFAGYAILLMATSRAVTAVFVVYLSLLLYAMLVAKIRRLYNRYALTFFGILLLSVLASLALPLFADYWERVNEARFGSSSERFFIYKVSILSVFEAHPFIGFGVRDMFEGSRDIPIGSHSTFVAVLYKSGILGFFFLLGFFVIVAVRAFALLLAPGAYPHDRSMAAGALAFFGSLAFEDIDALPLVGFLYFALVALVVRRGEELARARRQTICVEVSKFDTDLKPMPGIITLSSE